jgi:hypothetical protein
MVEFLSGTPIERDLTREDSGFFILVLSLSDAAPDERRAGALAEVTMEKWKVGPS